MSFFALWLDKCLGRFSKQIRSETNIIYICNFFFVKQFLLKQWLCRYFNFCEENLQVCRETIFFFATLLVVSHKSSRPWNLNLFAYCRSSIKPLGVLFNSNTFKGSLIEPIGAYLISEVNGISSPLKKTTMQCGKAQVQALGSHAAEDTGR